MKKVVSIIVMVIALTVPVSASFANTDTDYASALKFYNSGNYKQAAVLLKAYVEKHPNPAAYYRLGYSLYELGRHDEANEYFREAYLIDPEYSLEISGRAEKYPEDAVREGSQTAIEPSQMTKPSVSAEMERQAAPVTEPPVSAQAQSSGLPAEAPVPPEVPAPPLPQQIQPPQTVQPPQGFPMFPEGGQEMPLEMQGTFMKLMAIIIPFLTVFLIIAIAVQIFWVVCHYLIAKKLGVPSAWVAFLAFSPLIINVLMLVAGPESLAGMKSLVMILSVIFLLAFYVGYHWPVVGSAGKPWWWMLLPIPLTIVSFILMLLPIIGFILVLVLFAAFYGYLYMCITENLGKNRWLGLLAIIPIANIVWIGILAFSKAEVSTAESFGVPLA